MHFFCKLVPPRPTFATDMDADERRLMEEHAIYWRGWAAKGHILAFGVVADPAGAYGAGMATFDTLEDAERFGAGDPTIKSGRGFSFEAHPMPFGVVLG